MLSVYIKLNVCLWSVFITQALAATSDTNDESGGVWINNPEVVLRKNNVGVEFLIAQKKS